MINKASLQEITKKLLEANEELAYLNSEKENRAAELAVANQELLHQNSEKEKRAAELVIANKELVYQNTEKEKRAAELVIANRELLHRNSEKEKRAADLISANQKLSFQMEENSIQSKRLIESLKSTANLESAQVIALLGNWEFNMETESFHCSDVIYASLGVDTHKEIPSIDYFLSFIHPDDLEETKLRFNKALSYHKLSAFHFRFIRKNGHIGYGFTEIKFEFDENNKPLRVLGVFQDLTVRRLVEIEKEKVHSELIQRTENLEQFAYIISHNLSAPVANILGVSDLLKENISEKDRNRCMDVIFKATRQLDMLLKDLHFILNIQSDVTAAVKESFNIENLVLDIEASIQNLLKEETVTIETDFLACNQIISIKAYVYSVLFNLISNSIKYRKPGIPSVIKICSQLTKKGVQINYKDNGIGIDLRKHGNKIFGLYQRFHFHKEGKGLGLYMIKTQVEALGGKIHVYSEPNEGIEFVIDLPN